MLEENNGTFILRSHIPEDINKTDLVISNSMSF